MQRNRPCSVAMLLTTVLSIAACAPMNGTPPTADAQGPCRNEGLDRFVGQTVSTTLGADMLKASGARTLRWGAPGMAIKMDFRPDRLTVSYDDAMRVTSVRCG